MSPDKNFVIYFESAQNCGIKLNIYNNLLYITIKSLVFAFICISQQSNKRVLGKRVK